MSDLDHQSVTERLIEDTYEATVTTLSDGSHIHCPPLCTVIVDCEFEDVAFVPKDKVVAIKKILNWADTFVSAIKLHHPEHADVTTALLANTYESTVGVVKYEGYDDMIGKYGPCPPGCVPIIDAEMDLVMFAPEEKAHALASILNWAVVNVRTPDVDVDGPA